MFQIVCFVTAFVIYTYGYPAFDGARPAALDRQVRQFHGAVNDYAAQTGQAFAVLNDARTMQYLNPLMSRIAAQLRT